jgi:hydroxymethylbilane synthase
VAELDASCRTPVGAHAHIDNGRMTIDAFVGLPDGSTWIRDSLTGDAKEPGRLGHEAAARLRAVGADELLKQAEAAAR